MELLFWLGVFAAVLLPAQFILAPLLVYRSQRLPARYCFEMIDPESFLSDRTPTFVELHRKLLEHQFEHIGSSSFMMSQVRMYFSIYNQSDLKLACVLSTAYSEPMNSTQIEFTQLYADGSVMNISNNPLFEIYPPHPRKLNFRFPDSNDFDQLLDAAQRLIASQKPGIQHIGLEPGHEIETIERYLNEELDALVQTGWVSSRVAQGQRRLTFKGATLMTWKLCWPIKGLLDRADAARARRALRQTG